MKYPVLTHFRGPRARNHFVVALLAVSDAAALDIALRPSVDHTDARLFLCQASSCLRDVAYAMRRIDPDDDSGPLISRTEFDEGCARLTGVGYPAEQPPGEAWEVFTELRRSYAPVAFELLYWTIAAPAPWSGERDGFPGLIDRPDEPNAWPARHPSTTAPASRSARKQG